MGKKRAMNETLTGAEVVVSTEDIAEAKVEDENPVYERLFASVQEIRNIEGVLGYILRGESKAAVDLDDHSKLVEFALFSSQTFETANAVGETFGLGEIDSVVVEGKDMKAFSVNLDENKLTLFLEKATPVEGLLEKLYPQ